VNVLLLPDSQERVDQRRSYVSRRVETDNNGRSEIANLRPGTYSVSVDEIGGFVFPTRQQYVIVTELGTAVITVRVERAGAIEGRIQDENGEGILGAQIQAVRHLSLGLDTAPAMRGASANTNDRGEFRLLNLSPGTYYVVATFIRLQRGNEPAPPFGYANTYYRGAPSLREARVVVVRAGRDRERVNFTLARSRLSTLSIRATDSHGVALGQEAQMTLTKRDDVYLPYSPTLQTSRREDGTFLFEGLQPGDYYLVATTSARMEEAAYVNVRVRGENAALSVQTNVGARASGRILIDGHPAEEGGARLPNVTVAAFPPLGKYGPVYARVPLAPLQATGRFELIGLRGPMVLSAEIGMGATLSIQRRGEELAGKTLEFAGTETIDDIVVMLTTQVARLDVSVTTSRKEPETVLLFLFSEDPAQWHQGFIQYSRTTAAPASDPRPIPFAVTQLIRMPPGRYLLAAIHDVDLNYPTHLRVLEKLRPIAMPVTLTAGQTSTAKITVARVARESKFVRFFLGTGN